MASKSEFEDIAMVHLDAVYRGAFALCAKADMAEDLVQTTFLKAFERFESFQSGTNCRAWLMQILRNIWIDRLRHNKFAAQQMPFDEELIADRPHENETVWSNAQDMMENFSDEQVIRALQELGANQRLTLFLADVEGFSQNEIARITNVEVGTVKSRISRARAQLKKKLASYADQMGLTGGKR